MIYWNANYGNGFGALLSKVTVTWTQALRNRSSWSDNQGSCPVPAGKSVYSLVTLDKGMVHVPGGREQDGTRFHHTTQNSVQLNLVNVFICNFPFHVFGPWWLKLQKVELWVDKGVLLHDYQNTM